ncbi:hypothetical protein GCM10009544_23860 [Streptomyces stramineus]|uniref:Orc1-like AAA ATPase domain-containing protein n=1 Tax=Streptomyces stramineus TaxID=173861 RepID=A0ABN0ZVN0_9ACTN
MPVPAPDTRPSLLGRDHWLRVLRAHIDRASSGSGGLVLVTGEAGIGKTSLVGRAIQEGESRGLCVLRGSCWDADSTPGYWPWTQVFRGLRRGAGEGDGEAGAGTALPALLGACATDGQTDRFQLFDAATTQLSAASRQRPVLVVLEDLHWADPASVGLLDFAAQHIRFERLLILATCRDAEIERPGHPLRPLFRSLATRATTVPLTGLGEADVAELMQRTAGTRPAEDVVGEVRRRTGGNPFFVQEAARLWAAGHAVTAISPGLRASLEQRLSLLAPPVAECLGAASVLGRQFRPGTLARVLGAPSAQVAQWLAEAVDAQLVERAEGAGFAFKHDLVRETLYDALGADRARRLHAAAVAALRDAGSAQSGARPTELAHHAYLAFEELDRDEAVALLVSAARDAESRVAQEEAAGHFARALERAGEKPGPGRVLLALDFGLSLQLVGDHERSWAVFADAVRLAEGLADPLLVGRTALTLFGADGQGDTGLLKSRALHRAHALLVPGPPAEPALDVSQSRLAREVARRVVAAARAAGDADALHIGLWARLQAEWGPRVVRDRPALAQELIAVARRRGDRWTEHVAMSMLWVAALEADDPRFLEHFHAMVEVAAASGSPRMRLTAVIDRSVVDAVTGRFTEAAHLLDTAVSLSGSPAGYYQYFTFHHRWALLLLRGRFTEARALHGELREHGHPYVDLLEAITELEAGEGPTLPVPRPGAGASGDTVLHHSVTPLWLRYQAQSAAASGDRAWCEQVRNALSPYTGQWLVSLYGWDVSGPASLWTGVLDAALGQWDSAVRQLAAAKRSADRLHARPWSVRAGLELAAAMSARAAGSPEAAMLLREATAEARRLGMGHLVERADSPLSVRPPREAPPADEFRRDGSVWRLTFRGRTVHVPDAKGLHDLHCLLGRPGEDIAAARLLDPHHDTTAEAAGAMGADDILDEETKRRYRLHLQRLDAEIDQAVKLGDDSRAAAYDRERAALLEELRRSTGLAGRSRRLGDASERARKNVTARIRDTLRRLDERHPELAAHLREAVSTGTTCRYAPDAEIRWRL